MPHESDGRQIIIRRWSLVAKDFHCVNLIRFAIFNSMNRAVSSFATERLLIWPIEAISIIFKFLIATSGDGLEQSLN